MPLQLTHRFIACDKRVDSTQFVFDSFVRKTNDLLRAFSITLSFSLQWHHELYGESKLRKKFWEMIVIIYSLIACSHFKRQSCFSVKNLLNLIWLKRTTHRTENSENKKKSKVEDKKDKYQKFNNSKLQHYLVRTFYKSCLQERYFQNLLLKKTFLWGFLTSLFLSFKFSTTKLSTRVCQNRINQVIIFFWISGADERASAILSRLFSD